MNRDTTLKQAEKLLRQGKLDGAIAEYVRLVEDQPRDWNAINALGDLYVRSGEFDRAVAQFTRIGDYLFGEKMLPKAAALYRKALRVKADHEHTLLRLSEIAAAQGNADEARTFLRQLETQRRASGDSRGAAECLLRLALLDGADAETKIAGAHAARELGDTGHAVTLLKEAADTLTTAGERARALEALLEAASLDDTDTALRHQLALELVAAGRLDEAGAFVTRESAGSDPDLLLALGRIELAAGRDDARAVLTRLMTVAPDRSGVLLALTGELASTGAVDAAFTCADVLVDDALLASDWDRAVMALRALLKHEPHVPALNKMVELAVDAGREDVLLEAQEHLADAYLAMKQGAEARVIAEDLVSRYPESDAHVTRLHRALALLGITEAEAEAVVVRSRELAGLDALLDFELPVESADVFGEERAETAAADGPSLEAVEIDLSDALAQLTSDVPEPAPAAVRPAPKSRKGKGTGTGKASSAAEPADLEAVFDDMRSRAALDPAAAEAAAHYERGVKHLEHGRQGEAIAELEAAARSPQFRFRAGAKLGRLHLGRGNLKAGVEWLERAAEAPPASAEEGRAVLYDLASALERSGDKGRALALLMEIEADGAGFRDVRTRIEDLARAEARR